MQATLQDDGTLALELESLDEAREFFATARRQHGFAVDLDRRLDPFHRLTVNATAPPSFAAELDAEVVQLFPGRGAWGTAFQLRDWSPEKDADLERRLSGEDDSLHESELSPIFKIKRMNPNERFRLASRATRTERQILIRDTSPQVLMGLLNHPRIENKEVLEIVKSNFATGGTMEQVARNRKWMQSTEIQSAIVKSPKTPPVLAIKLLDGLPTNDLRLLAKSTAVRESLRKAALRVYMKRSGQRA